MLDRFLKKLSSAEREVTLCYAAVDGLTWTQAAFRAGKLAEMGGSGCGASSSGC